MLVQFLAIYAEGMGVVGTSFQLAKVLKTKVTRGLSEWTLTLNIAGNIAWIIFGVQESIVAVIVANCILFFLFSAILYNVIDSSSRSKFVLYFLLFGSVLGATFLYLPALAGWLAAIYGLLSSLPQLRKVIVDEKIDGISFTSYFLWLTAEMATVLYAYSLGAWPILFAGFRGLITFVIIMYTVAKKNPKRSRLW